MVLREADDDYLASYNLFSSASICRRTGAICSDLPSARRLPPILGQRLTLSANALKQYVRELTFLLTRLYSLTQSQIHPQQSSSRRTAGRFLRAHREVTLRIEMHRLRPKWHPIPYIVHYF
jgi:hypothetical protein